jgi:hypothetical protein
MIRRAFAACALGALVFGFTYPVASAATDPLAFDIALPEAPAQATPGRHSARFAVLPLQGVTADDAVAQAAAGATVPMWSATIKDGTSKFTYSMVGNNPLVTEKAPSTTINSFVVPIAVNFTSAGVVFDPTKRDPVCANNLVPLTLTAQSPLFNNVSITVGGTDLGSSQYVDLFQRGNFFKYTKPGAINPGYHVLLADKALATSKVTLNIGSGGAVFAATCGKLGTIDINTFDSFLQSTVFPALPASVATNTFPIFLLYGVVLTDGGCCIIGYHTGFTRAGVLQTYAVADYDTSRDFNNLSDVSAMSHEVGEWMDDPLGNNPTKPWGHIGQVSGCQNNLEVGDPLSGDPLASFTMKNKVTYHVQDLTFLSWFYHQTPSIGVNGWYSLFGTFRSAALPCT